MTIDPAAVAAQFAAALASGEDDATAPLMDPDVRVWHNNDLMEQTLAQNQKVGRWMKRKIPDLRFEQIRQTVTANGWVQQHVMAGTGTDGKPFALHSCLLVSIGSDGRIVRMDEYFDTAQLPTLS